MNPRILPTTAIRESRDGRHAWDGIPIEEPAGLRKATWAIRIAIPLLAVGLVVMMCSLP